MIYLTFGPFAETFEELTGVKLALYSLSNRTAGTALQFTTGRVRVCRSVRIRAVQQLAKMDILFSIVRPHYGSSFVVKADGDIQTLADLKGKRVALKDVGSTSGHIFPMMLMAKPGSTPSDAEIIMAGDAHPGTDQRRRRRHGRQQDWDAVRKQDPKTGIVCWLRPTRCRATPS